MNGKYADTRPRYKYQNMEDKYYIQIHHWSKRKSPGAKLLQVQSLCKVSMPVLYLHLIQIPPLAMGTKTTEQTTA